MAVELKKIILPTTSNINHQFQSMANILVKDTIKEYQYVIFHLNSSNSSDV